MAGFNQAYFAVRVRVSPDHFPCSQKDERVKLDLSLSYASLMQANHGWRDVIKPLMRSHRRCSYNYTLTHPRKSTGVMKNLMVV